MNNSIIQTTISVALLFSVVSACNKPGSQNSEVKSTDVKTEIAKPGWTFIPAFDSILMHSDMKGIILIYNPANQMYFTNDSTGWQHGTLPASTYKIVNSIIGLEAGAIPDTSYIFKWDGKPRRLPQWEEDMTLPKAYKVSCVPCYQELATRIGVERMQHFIDTFQYGKISVTDSNLTNFWLEGEAQVSPFDQLQLLQKLFEKRLPISERTHSRMMSVMTLEQNDSLTFFGKTGWAIRNGENTGWFVGALKNKSGFWYFATRVQPEEDFNMNLFPKIRSEVTLKAFSELGLYPEVN
ncbi:MAG: class D beta-lactamase [Bacteroidetes bacterium]|nr:class D beta-lactamase [Bacteroidota bacterium]